MLQCCLECIQYRHAMYKYLGERVTCGRPLLRYWRRGGMCALTAANPEPACAFGLIVCSHSRHPYDLATHFLGLVFSRTYKHVGIIPLVLSMVLCC